MVENLKDLITNCDKTDIQEKAAILYGINEIFRTKRNSTIQDTFQPSFVEIIMYFASMSTFKVIIPQRKKEILYDFS